MKAGIAATVTLIAALGCGEAAAKTTGNELLNYCQTMIRVMDNGTTTQSLEEAFNAGQCLGFVSGVRNASELSLVPEPIRSCTPQSATMGQLARVITKYLKDNPSELNLDQTFLAMLALKGAYPCKT